MRKNAQNTVAMTSFIEQILWWKSQSNKRRYHNIITTTLREVCGHKMKGFNVCAPIIPHMSAFQETQKIKLLFHVKFKTRLFSAYNNIHTGTQGTSISLKIKRIQRFMKSKESYESSSKREMKLLIVNQRREEMKRKEKSGEEKWRK